MTSLPKKCYGNQHQHDSKVAPREILKPDDRPITPSIKDLTTAINTDLQTFSVEEQSKDEELIHSRKCIKTNDIKESSRTKTCKNNEKTSKLIKIENSHCDREFNIKKYSATVVDTPQTDTEPITNECYWNRCESDQNIQLRGEDVEYKFDNHNPTFNNRKFVEGEIVESDDPSFDCHFTGAEFIEREVENDDTTFINSKFIEFESESESEIEIDNSILNNNGELVESDFVENDDTTFNNSEFFESESESEIKIDNSIVNNNGELVESDFVENDDTTFNNSKFVEFESESEIEIDNSIVNNNGELVERDFVENDNTNFNVDRLVSFSDNEDLACQFSREKVLNWKCAC